MSHVATHWLATVSPTDLTHGEFRVLFHLCDCHNPAHGCFPTQSYLMEVTGLSNGGLNKALSKLEGNGLIKRRRAIEKRTRQRMPTRYILGFEYDEPQEPSPLSGDGNDPENDKSHLHSVEMETAKAISTQSASHLHPGGVYINAEPVREPVREEEERAGARAGKSFDDFFSALLRVCGFSADEDLPVWWHGDGARAHVSRWIGSLGLSEDRVLDVARKFRAEKPDRPQGPKAMDRAMERAARGATKSAKKKSGTVASEDDQISFYAEWINSDRFLPKNAVSDRMVGLLIERGSVTRDRLSARGVI